MKLIFYELFSLCDCNRLSRQLRRDARDASFYGVAWTELMQLRRGRPGGTFGCGGRGRCRWGRGRGGGRGGRRGAVRNSAGRGHRGAPRKRPEGGSGGCPVSSAGAGSFSLLTTPRAF